MKKAILTAALAALAACSGQPQERPRLVKIGLPAPEIALRKVLNAPVTELNSIEELKGKVVVLEFWATWCEPCAEYLPVLNQLAERFRGKPVVFIHITDESEADVNEFLKLNRIDGWIAPEAGAAAFKAFRVYGRPHTVVIGKDGVVAAIPHGDLDAEALMGLLAGRAETGPPSGPGADAAQAQPLAEFSIARSAGRSGMAQYGPASLNASSMSLEYALEWLYGKVDVFDIKPSAAQEMSASYDIRLRLPVDRAAAKKKFFLDGLEAALGLKVVKTEREAEVYVLKTAPGGLLNVKKRQKYGGAEIKGAVIDVKGSSFAVLALRLKEVLKLTVLDETGDAGPYEYSFELDSRDPELLDQLLRKRLGLKLSKLRRKITVVEITGPAAPKQ